MFLPATERNIIVDFDGSRGVQKDFIRVIADLQKSKILTMKNTPQPVRPIHYCTLAEAGADIEFNTMNESEFIINPECCSSPKIIESLSYIVRHKPQIKVVMMMQLTKNYMRLPKDGFYVLAPSLPREDMVIKYRFIIYSKKNPGHPIYLTYAQSLIMMRGMEEVSTGLSKSVKLMIKNEKIPVIIKNNLKLLQESFIASLEQFQGHIDRTKENLNMMLDEIHNQKNTVQAAN